MLPLVVDVRLLDMWELPRATVLWIGALLALTTLVVERATGRRTARKPLGTAGWALAAVIAAVLLSTLTSVSPVRSVVGDQGRYEGLLTFAAYGALFYVASQTLSDSRGFERIGVMVTVLGAGVSIYGIAQFFALDPFVWPEGRFESFRSFSTLGNPMYLGEYLALCLPIAVSLAVASRGRRRAVALIAVALIATCLATSVTRGSWIGAGLGVVATVAVLLRSHRLSARRASLAVGATAVTLAVAVAVITVSPPASQVGARLASTATVLGGSIGTRIELLRSSASLVAERPLLGWGPDTYRLACPRYATVQQFRLAGRDVVEDNAHNYFAHLAATGGILTLGAFVWLLVVCLRRALLRRPESLAEAALVAGATGAVVGYLGALLFGISIVAGGGLMWTVLGMLAARGAQTLPLERTIPGRLRLPALLGALALFVLASLGLVQPYRAEITYSRAVSTAGDVRAIEATVRAFRLAAEQAPYQEQYLLAAGRYFNDLARATGDVRYRLAAVERFLTARKTEPLETNTYTMLGATYLDLANETGNDQYRDLGIGQLLQETELSPSFAPGHFLLGCALSDAGNPTDAIPSLRTAVEIDPTYGQAWRVLGEAYETVGDSASARQAFDEADALAD